MDWPKSVKDLQRNWIGKSEGCEVDFKIKGLNSNITVYTTRPDTLFGVSYVVLSPEHPLVEKLTLDEKKVEVEEYIKLASTKSDFDRGELNKDKTGVFIGSYAINPVNNAEIPIWIADYVLMSYGTGSIMAVPGHDNRDFDFAKKFELPIIEVVEGGNLEKAAFTGKNGKIINSSNEDGLDLNQFEVKEAIEKTILWLESKELGRKKIQYKLKDWLFSRQRYWGEPIPIIHNNDQTIPLDESDLPLKLPKVDMYEPSETGESPLANIPYLLYTSPSPRDKRQSRMPSSA